MRPKRTVSLLVGVCLIGLSLVSAPGSAFAQTGLTGFGSNWTTNGSAFIAANSLTLTTTTTEDGTAFYNQRVSVSGPWEASFSETSSNANGSYPGDGFAFVVQNDPRGVHAAGYPGGDMGYGAVGGFPSDAISPSAIVEFDTYPDASLNDPNSVPYAAYMEDGNPAQHYAYGGYSYNGNPQSSTGATEYFWIDYGGANGLWSVYENATDSKPATPLFTYTDLITNRVGASTAYIGFTGTNGSAVAQQVINNFTFTYGAYDIESSNFYCTGGGTACIPAGYTAYDCASVAVACPGLNYADVEAFGPTNGSTYGVPDELVLFCAHDTSAGTPGYDFGWVDVVSPQGQLDYPREGGPSHLYGVYQNANPGFIGGKGTLLQASPPSATGMEYNNSQVSSIDVSASDPDQALAEEVNGKVGGPYLARGSVTGIQDTDNGGDTLNAGQFRITITGYLYHVYGTGPNDAYTYWGTISCTAGGPQSQDIVSAGLETPNNTPVGLAEGELEVQSSLGDNPFFISPPIPLG